MTTLTETLNKLQKKYLIIICDYFKIKYVSSRSSDTFINSILNDKNITLKKIKKVFKINILK